MIRNLKTLGLTLVAITALSAAMAAVASAAPKLTPVPEEYPVTVKGSQTVTTVLELEGTRPTECTTLTVEGTLSSKAEAETSELALTPTFSGCTTTLLGNRDPSTITNNGCRFITQNSETTTGTIAAEGWEVTAKTVRIECPIGQVLELHTYASAAKHAANEPICTWHIGSQTVGGDLDKKHEEKNAEGAGTSGKIKLTLTGVAATKTAGTLVNCGGATTTGSLRGEVKTELFNSLGSMLRGKYED
jgi:hypothetical protein